ncbi:MAG TPA: Spy/CpxP family protein refolding chaperone [Chthoniobacterales bacterium]|nr:Spy/CpxP family protein refolding chaperone [Chthoniobacterales bacterium]
MKRNLLLLTAVVALVLGGLVIAFAEIGPGADPGDHGGWRGHGFGVEHIAKVLKLTPEQQAKVEPIVDQTRPQIAAIHREAMQKAHAVLDQAMSQIRPLLTPEQQKKLDDLKKAHEDMRKAHEELRAAMGE